DRAIACGVETETRGRLRLVQAEAYRWRGDAAECAHHAAKAAQDLTRGGRRWFQALGEAIVASARQGRTDLVRLWLETVARAEPLPGAEGAQVDALCRGAGQLLQAGLLRKALAVIGRAERIAGDPQRLDAHARARLCRVRGRR